MICIFFSSTVSHKFYFKLAVFFFVIFIILILFLLPLILVFAIKIFNNLTLHINSAPFFLTIGF